MATICLLGVFPYKQWLHMCIYDSLTVDPAPAKGSEITVSPGCTEKVSEAILKKDFANGVLMRGVNPVTLVLGILGL